MNTDEDFIFSFTPCNVKGFRIINLSKEIRPETGVPGAVGYSDPHTVFTGDWVTTAVKPYYVSKIIMGAHAGTHIDAAMHVTGQKSDSIDKIEQKLVGSCVAVDLDNSLTAEKLKQRLEFVTDKTIVVIRGKADCDAMTPVFRDLICAREPLAVVFGECVNIVGVDDSEFFCEKKVPMIMDAVNLDAIIDGDIIFALPILISGIEASPVRLFAVRLISDNIIEEEAELPPIVGD